MCRKKVGLTGNREPLKLMWLLLNRTEKVFTSCYFDDLVFILQLDQNLNPFQQHINETFVLVFWHSKCGEKPVGLLSGWWCFIICICVNVVNKHPCDQTRPSSLKVLPPVVQNVRAQSFLWWNSVSCHLPGFGCRCGNLFCGIHRYSDKHNCPYDYKTEAADKIRKENPVVVAEKIQRIWGAFWVTLEFWHWWTYRKTWTSAASPPPTLLLYREFCQCMTTDTCFWLFDLISVS